MRKLIVSLIMIVVLASGVLGSIAAPISAAGSKNAIEVLLDARKMSFPDAQPFQDGQGSVMLPIRFVSEALGAKVGWNKVAGTMVVDLKNGDHTVQMTVGQAMATVDGASKSYGTKIILNQNRTFVPLRLVSEGLGQTVEWDKVSRWVWIGRKDAPTLEEIGIKPVDVAPYKKWFTKKPYLLKNQYEKEYKEALVFKISDLPTSLLKEVYSVEEYLDSKTKNTYIKIRAKTKSGAGNIYYLTDKNDVRFRNPIPDMTINHGDGTKTCFYKVWSAADGTLDGIKDYKNLKLKDVQFIGFRGGSDDYLTLMVNPWKGN
ncbi:copper amine oxidase [Paenibacillus selenitireducens]|uniref:Copper amine oxidase n=1 Tax=Paenibacillus selenitireducens TaxID=1324314 RepID=A0A1T2X3Q0_9BACL|nr:stalk domain-containing protein [Paenibacillus selenitireducens]OPA74326.1 copper amine oxidase [Paenibacillus selenitireducens]